ncbi:MAG: IPT/TIG domain-containing protein [Frankiaceae bacterium]
MALAMLLATWATPADAAAGGPDLSVSIGGNFPTGPSTGGPTSLTFTNVGTAPVSGITHVTLDTPASGLTLADGYILSGAAQFSFTSAVSPDGHHLDGWFNGAVQVGAYISIRGAAAAGPAGPLGTITATVANAGDVNPANNLASVDVVTHATLPPPPAPAPPTVTSVSPTGGPSTGGTPIVVTGTNLTQGLLTIGDRRASGVACTDNTCAATTPIGTNSVDVRVTTPGGTSVAADQFTYRGDLPIPPPPTVTLLTPPVGAAGGGTSITLNGGALAGGQRHLW